MGILQARILEWVAMPTSRGSSWPWDQTQLSQVAGRFFTIWVTREAQTAYSIIKIITASCLGTMPSSPRATIKVARLPTGGLQVNAGHHLVAWPSVHYENLASCKDQPSHLCEGSGAGYPHTKRGPVPHTSSDQPSHLWEGSGAGYPHTERGPVPHTSSVMCLLQLQISLFAIHLCWKERDPCWMWINSGGESWGRQFRELPELLLEWEGLLSGFPPLDWAGTCTPQSRFQRKSGACILRGSRPGGEQREAWGHHRAGRGPWNPGSGEAGPWKGQRPWALGLDTAPTSSRREDWQVSKLRLPLLHRGDDDEIGSRTSCHVSTQHRVGSRAGAQIAAEMWAVTEGLEGPEEGTWICHSQGSRALWLRGQNCLRVILTSSWQGHTASILLSFSVLNCPLKQIL